MRPIPLLSVLAVARTKENPVCDKRVRIARRIVLIRTRQSAGTAILEEWCSFFYLRIEKKSEILPWIILSCLAWSYLTTLGKDD
jgi:hypothetical protein